MSIFAQLQIQSEGIMKANSSKNFQEPYDILTSLGENQVEDDEHVVIDSCLADTVNMQTITARPCLKRRIGQQESLP